jgi:ABC-type multidrug transport system fused ATPase/permease subunit
MFLSLARLVVQMQSSLAGASRVFQVLNHTTEANQESGFPFHHIEEAAGEPKAIKIEKLNFHYQDGMNVLKNISLTVPTGSTAALVGYSGNGKSTLIKLLLGFYQPQEGYIQIGNRVLSPETLTECRSDIAYVSQESFMFEGTIEENIRYGRLDATKEEIILAAKAANAHAFIVQMENGYETEIGENASRLSGGQKQRIAIARAILKDAPILLLDEATSALDAESESLIQSSLQTLMEGRTSLVIAHRLTTIENANRIYVLDDGQIIQEGTHGHLMEQAGVYKSLFENSFGEAQTRVPMS